MDRTVSIQLSDRQREQLLSHFGDQVQRHVSLSRYTAARIGGAADWLIEVEFANQLAEIVAGLWDIDIPFFILGGGSNVLVSDLGIREVVILNKARHIQFDADGSPPSIWAEAGANIGLIARQCARRGLSGLEWAAGIPGTVGGAVFGNAGAHGGDVAGSLQLAEILHKTEYGYNREKWNAEDFRFEYRSASIKRDCLDAVVLTAQFNLQPGDPIAIQAQMDAYAAYRRQTQPPGASMGSMFKNPSQDYAGRLIEAAELKGTRIGGAEISPVHANFFINHEDATASEVYKLIKMTQEKVAEQFNVQLELEIELVGEW